jgi:hypothetical protein
LAPQRCNVESVERAKRAIVEERPKKYFFWGCSDQNFMRSTPSNKTQNPIKTQKNPDAKDKNGEKRENVPVY